MRREHDVAHIITLDQERAIVSGIERLSYALQVFADRASGEIGGATASDLMVIGAEVNRSICEAFPHVVGLHVVDQ